MHCRNFSACRVRSVPVQRSDFHLGADDDPDDREPKDLFIDVLIGLPELADGTADERVQIEREGKSRVL